MVKHRNFWFQPHEVKAIREEISPVGQVLISVPSV